MFDIDWYSRCGDTAVFENGFLRKIDNRRIAKKTKIYCLYPTIFFLLSRKCKDCSCFTMIPTFNFQVDHLNRSEDRLDRYSYF